MPNLGPTELAIIVQIVLTAAVFLIIPYLVIRQAVLSALRKFHRELDEAGGKSKMNAVI